MKKPTVKIDVRKVERIPERLKEVSRELDGIKQGDYALIVADDKRMLTAAPQMIKSIGKGKFIKSWQADDGYFYTLVEKL